MKYIWHMMDETPELFLNQKSCDCFCRLKNGDFITARYHGNGDWCSVESGDSISVDRFDMWCYINDALERIF